MKDPYEVLGVPKDASEAQIRYAYRQALRERESGESPVEVQERMDEVEEAYRTLSDPRCETRGGRCAAGRAGTRAGAGAAGARGGRGEASPQPVHADDIQASAPVADRARLGADDCRAPS